MKLGGAEKQHRSQKVSVTFRGLDDAVTPLRDQTSWIFIE